LNYLLAWFPAMILLISAGIIGGGHTQAPSTGHSLVFIALSFENQD
jgi:hypothetical protein